VSRQADRLLLVGPPPLPSPPAVGIPPTTAPTNLVAIVDDFPQRIPDMLESATERVRSLTVDRVARILKILALGLVITVLVVLALVFLFVGLARIIDGLISHACGDCSWSMQVTYGALGGLFLLFGALLWSARTKRKDPEEPRT